MTKNKQAQTSNTARPTECHRQRPRSYRHHRVVKCALEAVQRERERCICLFRAARPSDNSRSTNPHGAPPVDSRTSHEGKAGVCFRWVRCGRNPGHQAAHPWPLPAAGEHGENARLFGWRSFKTHSAQHNPHRQRHCTDHHHPSVAGRGRFDKEATRGLEESRACWKKVQYVFPHSRSRSAP